jgi:Peptidase family M23
MSTTLPFKNGQIQSQEFGFTEFATSQQGKAIYGNHPHEGIDLYSNEDPTVCSIANGTVIIDNDSYQGSDSGLFASYGNHVVIKDDNTNRAWYYCHLDSNSVYGGQKVKAGDPIGVMGGSGSGSRSKFGSHIHLGRAILDSNNSRINRNALGYGFIDGADDLQKAIEEYNSTSQPTIIATTQPQIAQSQTVLDGKVKFSDELMEKAKSIITDSVHLGHVIGSIQLVKDQGIGDILGDYCDRYKDLDNYYKLSETQAEIIKTQAEQLLQQENLIKQLPITSLPVEQTEKEREYKAELDAIQVQKELDAIANNPLTLKLNAPLSESRTIRTGGGALTAITAILGSSNIPMAKDYLAQYIGTDMCNYLGLALGVSVLANIYMLFLKYSDKKILNPDNLKQYIELGNTGMATMQDFLAQSKSTIKEAKTVLPMIEPILKLINKK